MQLARLLTLLLLATLLLSGESGHAGTVVTIGSAPGYPGATISVPVTMRNSNTIVAAQFDLSYNAAKVTFGDLAASPRLASHVVRSRQVAPGVRRTVIYSMNNTAIPGTNGPLATAPFKLASTEFASSGPLTPGNAILARPD